MNGTREDSRSSHFVEASNKISHPTCAVCSPRSLRSILKNFHCSHCCSEVFPEVESSESVTGGFMFFAIITISYEY
jgi:hypothetical protein